MNKKGGSGTGIFMMEMIMVVFFFILCASTCILVFVKSNSMSRLAKDTNKGVLAAESVAETWKAEGVEGLLARYSAEVSLAETKQGICTVYWDRQWQEAGEADSEYAVQLNWTRAGNLAAADITVTRLSDKTELFAVTAKKYMGSEGEGMFSNRP